MKTLKLKLDDRTYKVLEISAIEIASTPEELAHRMLVFITQGVREEAAHEVNKEFAGELYRMVQEILDKEAKE